MRQKLESVCTFSRSRDRILRFRCTIRNGAAGAQRGPCAGATALSSPSLPLPADQVQGLLRRPSSGVPPRHRPKRRRHLNGNRPLCSDSGSHRQQAQALHKQVYALSSPRVRASPSGRAMAGRRRPAGVQSRESAVATTAALPPRLGPSWTSLVSGLLTLLDR